MRTLRSVSECGCTKDVVQTIVERLPKLALLPAIGVGVGFTVIIAAGCGATPSTLQDSTFSNEGGSGGGASGASMAATSASSGISASSGGAGLSPGAANSSISDAGAPDATGATQLVCNDAGVCSCPGNTTTITGTVLDPAGVNPLYNVSVYVEDPNSPLPDLDTVPLGCGCSQLYPATVLADSLPTDATGAFQITCAPSGSVNVVVQTGKWRIVYPETITANQANAVGPLKLPANSSEGSLPNIAISTGGADSLECLPLRIGVSASEYVMGSSTGGHLHIYTGFGGAVTAQGSVASYQTLWDSQVDMNSHDVILLSCEGQETTGGNPGQALTATPQTYLMDYGNSGGRVFASHFHYAWFNTGPFDTGADQLATWITGAQAIDDNVSFPGDIDTTLSPSGAPFPEGTALDQWLGNVGALTNGQLPIWFTRHNVKALIQPPSTEWIHLDQSVTQAPLATQYFSVDTPIGSSGSSVCGRIVYSDLHVSGGPGANEPNVPPDYPNAGTRFQRGAGGGNVVPSGCAMHPLTPQEDALEFMLFDLSSCLVPIGQSTPSTPTVVVPPPPR